MYGNTRSENTNYQLLAQPELVRHLMFHIQYLEKQLKETREQLETANAKILNLLLENATIEARPGLKAGEFILTESGYTKYDVDQAVEAALRKEREYLDGKMLPFVYARTMLHDTIRNIETAAANRNLNQARKNLEKTKTHQCITTQSSEYEKSVHNLNNPSYTEQMEKSRLFELVAEYREGIRRFLNKNDEYSDGMPKYEDDGEYLRQQISRLGSEFAHMLLDIREGVSVGGRPPGKDAYRSALRTDWLDMEKEHPDVKPKGIKEFLIEKYEQKNPRGKIQEQALNALVNIKKGRDWEFRQELIESKLRVKPFHP